MSLRRGPTSTRAPLTSTATSSLTAVQTHTSIDISPAPNTLSTHYVPSPYPHTNAMNALSSVLANRPTLKDIMPERLTARSLIAGLFVGAILCASNTYFGLQSGWVTMGSLQSALLGYGIFRLGANLRPPLQLHFLGFTQEENVVLQTTAVATATMPLAAGLVGIIPAFNLLQDYDTGGVPVKLTSTGSLLLWSLSMAFFGVFIAIPLRKQVILKEKLRFPSGTATARVIRVLHLNPSTNSAVPPTTSNSTPDAPPNTSLNANANMPASASSLPDPETGALLPSDKSPRPEALGHKTEGELEGEELPVSATGGGDHGPAPDPASVQDFARSWRYLLWTFGGSGVYTVMQFFAPSLFLKSWPVLNWIGIKNAQAWGWEIQMSAGYFGQGMIMGPRVTLSMLGGAVVGWGILGPAAKAKGWARGPISSWSSGATGWILWVSLAIMLGDSLTSLAILILGQTLRKRMGESDTESTESPSKPESDPLADAGGKSGGLADGDASGKGASDAGAVVEPSVPFEEVRGRKGLGGGELEPDRGAEVEMATLAPGASLSPSLDNLKDEGEKRGLLDAHVIPSSSLGDHSTGGTLRRRTSPVAGAEEEDGEGVPSGAPCSTERDPPRVLWIVGAAGSIVVGSVILTIMFRAHSINLFHTIAAFIFSIFVAILAVRALGETDLNPVSGVGKLSQLLFGLLAPGNVVVNLVAGAIAEAGAMQAGDLMQDFKTAHLLGVCPRAQIAGQLVGSLCSVFVAVLSYKLYASQSPIPGAEFPAPTAGVWVQMARLANGGRLMPGVKGFCIGAFFLSCLNQILIDVTHNPSIRRYLRTRISDPILHDRIDRTMRVLDRIVPWLPSGIGAAVGMYVAPRWTLPRVIGTAIEVAWKHRSPSSHRQLMLVVASGLVLGEGTASIVVAACKALF